MGDPPANAVGAELESWVEFADRLPSAVFRTKRDGTILAANRALADLLGISQADLLGSDARRLYVDDRERDELLTGVAVTPEMYEYETELRRADGASISVRITGRTVFDDNGEIDSFYGVIEDITLRTEAVLDRSLYERVGSVIHRHHRPQDMLCAAAATLSDLLGFRYAEAWVPTAKGAMELAGAAHYHDESLAAIEPSAGAVRPLGALMAKVDSEVEWVENVLERDCDRSVPSARLGLSTLVVVPARTRSGPVGLMLFLGAHRPRDESTICRLTAAANQIAPALERLYAEQRYRRMIDATPNLVAVHAGEEVLYINPAGASMMGAAEASEIIGRPVMDFIDPSFADVAERRIAVGLSAGTGASAVIRESRYRRLDGTTVDVEAAVIPMLYQGHPAVQVVATDITARKEYERMMEQTIRSKDEMIATVSHELRTPLTAVLGFAELMHEALEDAPQEWRSMIETITHQSREMSFIVEDLLVAARTADESITIRDETVDLGEALRDVMVALGVDPAPVPRALVVADSIRTRQIIRNLLTNAARYGGKTVEVGVGSGKAHRWLEIIDDGPGVPDSHAERIFEPYVSLGNTEGKPGALGLGLSVSRRLARLMDGDLVYQRRGSLTVMRLVLPAA